MNLRDAIATTHTPCFPYFPILFPIRKHRLAKNRKIVSTRSIYQRETKLPDAAKNTLELHGIFERSTGFFPAFQTPPSDPYSSFGCTLSCRLTELRRGAIRNLSNDWDKLSSQFKETALGGWCFHIGSIALGLLRLWRIAIR
ncbi:hypothetical protein [uncultured Mameliella sp.]|uniref:hypothetical protein n=1 Tax=uncultured Mameliella sp. TaxID=1447087 RepID=UPI002621065D|nr:hypothetical protein [uncultured Mameliella sp.]